MKLLLLLNYVVRTAIFFRVPPKILIRFFLREQCPCLFSCFVLVAVNSKEGSKEKGEDVDFITSALTRELGRPVDDRCELTKLR